MIFTPNIQVFCCHYTSQQAIAEGDEGLRESGFPEGAVINRLACGGKLQVSSMLKAFEDGADGVCVVACPTDQCHNLMGSQRAAHRVLAVQKALEELGAGGDRISMSHLERGFHPEFVQAAKAMVEKVLVLGQSPFKAEKKVAAKPKKAAAKKSVKKAPAKPAATKTTKKAAAKPAAKKSTAKKTTKKVDAKPVKKAAKKPAVKKAAASKPAKKAAAKPAKKAAKAPAKKAAKKGGKK